MPNPSIDKPTSAISKQGLSNSLKLITEEFIELYTSDDIPWVIGYSGGKDSTATLQLVWTALRSLERAKLGKPIYVISTDTLVENPVVSTWVLKSLEMINCAAKEQGLPISAQQLSPDPTNSFWVNLLGRGYPAPRPKFRWCTERLKISPSHEFINSVVQRHGEAILVLGTRKAESTARATVMNRYEKMRVKDRLSPNGNLPNSFVYTPIEDWTNDDVWMFLMQVENPWGYNNKDLLTMYQGASPDNECPLVVDTSTPSCGDSRFGCWVCTMVAQDKSMQAMIQNDEEKDWMLPLLNLRNKFAPKNSDGKWDDRYLRDFRRMNGSVQLFHNRPIPGPYVQAVREAWLRDLLTAQQVIRETGPIHVQNIELIRLAELEEIRRIWVMEKHELEDSLPRIYSDAMGETYPGQHLDDDPAIGSSEIEILKDICGDDQLHFQLTRELLSREKRFRSMLRRAGLFKSIDSAFHRGFYENEDDATTRAQEIQALQDVANSQAQPHAEGLSRLKAPVNDRDEPTKEVSQ